MIKKIGKISLKTFVYNDVFATFASVNNMKAIPNSC